MRMVTCNREISRSVVGMEDRVENGIKNGMENGMEVGMELGNTSRG